MCSLKASFDTLFAEYLLDVVGSSVLGDEKLLVTSFPGRQPEQLYAAVSGLASTTVQIQMAGANHQFKAILRGSHLIIPFCVTGDHSVIAADSNQGTREFCSQLRDYYHTATLLGSTITAPLHRVLAIFDAAPVETQRTAANERLRARLLSPRRLSDFAVCLWASGKQAALLKEIALTLPFNGQPLDAVMLECLSHFLAAANTSMTRRDVGQHLPLLGLVRDPQFDESDPSKRIGLNYKIVSSVNGWVSDPAVDFAEQVDGHFNKVTGIPMRLYQARKLTGVDWSGFTLKELETAWTGPRDDDKEAKFANNQFLQVTAPGCQMHPLVNALRQKVATIQWSDAPLSLEVKLTPGSMRGAESLHLMRWPGPRHRRQAVTANVQKLTDGFAITNLVPEHANQGWDFIEIALCPTNKYARRLDTITVAFFRNADGYLPFEQDMVIDAHSGSFTIMGKPIPGLIYNGILQPGTGCEYHQSEETTEPGNQQEPDWASVTTANGSTKFSLPVIDGSVEPESKRDKAAPPLSREHILASLLAARYEAGQPAGALPEIQPFSTDRSLVFRAGDEKITIRPHPLLGEDALIWERTILASPDTLTWVASSSSDLHPNDQLEQRFPGPLGPQAERFLQARRSFFVACSKVPQEQLQPTLYIMDLRESAEAQEYVEAFLALLQAGQESGPQPYTERILLVDSIWDGQRLHVAPTHPLTVAFYRLLQQQAYQWQELPPDQQVLFAQDPKCLSAADLVPYLRLPETGAGTWLRSVPVESLLWRCYMPQVSLSPTALDSRLAHLVYRRLLSFLRVHPWYQNPHETLVVTFVDPGDGGYIYEAIRMFMRELRDQVRSDTIPRLELRLAGTGSAIGAVFDRQFALTRILPEPDPLDLEITQKVRYIKCGPQPSAFSHITFLNTQTPSATPRLVAGTSHPATSFALGLAAEAGQRTEENSGEWLFLHSVWFPRDLEGNPVLSIAQRMGALSVSLVTNQVESDRVVTFPVSLQRVLSPIYDHSVWVVHLDRTLGLRAFVEQEDLLIVDYEMDDDPVSGVLEGVTVAKQLEPYRACIQSAFQGVIDLTPVDVMKVLKGINILSGRWAIELIKGPDTDIPDVDDTETFVKERVGDVVALNLLQSAGLFAAREDGIPALIPLEEVLRVTPRAGFPTSSGLSARFRAEDANERCDDFLLLWVSWANPATIQVFAHIIEVKYCSTGAPKFAKAETQVKNTGRLLEYLFNRPNHSDRLFRSRDLAKLVTTGVERLEAFGLYGGTLSPDTREAFAKAIAEMAKGNFAFHTGFWHADKWVDGEILTVEPNYPVSFLQEAHGRYRSTRVGSEWASLLTGSHPQPPAGFIQPRYSVPPSQTQLPVTPPPSTVGEEGQQANRTDPERQPVVTPSPAIQQSTADSADTPEEISGPDPLLAKLQVPMQRLISMADQLDRVFSSYKLGVDTFSAAEVECGPSILRFRTRTLGSETLAHIARHADDIARQMGCKDGKVLISQDPPDICVDLPRSHADRITVRFEDVVHQLPNPVPLGMLPFVLGVSPSGQVKVADLAAMPHLLVAGGTGSGKSVFLTSLLGSLISRLSAERLQLVIVDNKGVDFGPFQKLPHLRGGGVIENASEAMTFLKELLANEIPSRRKMLRDAECANIIQYYQETGRVDLPQIVILVDEFANLVGQKSGAEDEFLSTVKSYAEQARSFGIHMVLATQRPSVKVMPGDLKANLLARIALKLPSSYDSRTILDGDGAEDLLGHGDLLYFDNGFTSRYQGPFIGRQTVQSLVKRRKS